MNTQTQTPASNDLRLTIDTFDKNGNTMRIKIRLNDECKNGHQDFAITADIWEKGKPKTDRYYIMGGCCHEEILKTHPELQSFVNLHLCDYKGIPIHAVENGYYHLTEGFTNCKPGSKDFKKEFCKYYRVWEWQYDQLLKAENKLQFALLLKDLHILDQWENEANEAIKQLENLTGKTFLVDSKKTQYNAPTLEEISEEKQKQDSGYYTPEAKEQRRKDAESKLMSDLLNEGQKKIDAIRTEYDIKAQVLQIGGKKALDNCIYYNHTNTLAFNWKRYDSIPKELVDKLTAEIKMPEGTKIENKTK